MIVLFLIFNFKTDMDVAYSEIRMLFKPVDLSISQHTHYLAKPLNVLTLCFGTS